QDDMSVDEEAVLIVGEVTSHPESSPPSPAMREKVEEVKRLIALSPARTFALKYLAASTNCSPFHLCRAFRRETGMSITNFQHGLRLLLALDMLRSTSSGLSDIALQ